MLPLLLRAKLNRPNLANDYVPRQQLVERLQKHRDRPFVLVSAPAGFGKSTLLSAWVHACDWPSAWLSLDEQDSDLITFLSYFISAIQTIFPAACQQTSALLNASSRLPASVLASHLSNELDMLDRPFVVVLDDYHAIGEPAVHRLLSELLRHPCRWLHLALATRQDPMLPLADLRARNKVTEIRSSELRFTLDEAATFLEHMLGATLDRRAAAALFESTDGWVAGLRLAALSLPGLGQRQGQGSSSNNGSDSRASQLIAAQQANANNTFVADYLISEVLLQQPREMQEFLLKTSILERMNGPLCDAVLGSNRRGGNDSDSRQEHLERIDKANLFVTRLAVDEHGHWYRYHHLFQQLLQRHLERSCSQEEIAALHRGAGNWLAQHGLIEDALRHLITAGDYANAVQLVAQRRHGLMNEEQWHRLGRWISLFPREVVETHAELLLSEAWIARSNARALEIPAKLDQAQELITQMRSGSSKSAASAAVEKATSLEGELECLRAYQSYWASDAQGALFHAQRGLKTTPQGWWSARLLARLMLVSAYQKMGNETSAYAAMYDAMKEPLSQDVRFQARLLVSAAFVHLAFADLDGLMQVCGQALASSGKLAQHETTYWAHFLIGVAHYYRNELPLAEEHLGMVIGQRYLANAQSAVQAMFALALTYQAQGQAAKARELADLATTFALEINHSLLLSAARAFQAELAVRQERLADAERWLEQFPREAITPTLFFTLEWLTSVKTLLARGPVKAPQAADELSRLCEFAQSNHDPRLLIEALTMQALLVDARGDREAALIALGRAVTLAQPSRILRTFLDLGPHVIALLNQLHSRGVATELVEAILAAAAQAKPVAATARQNGLIEPLTERELDVLALLGQRLSDKEIAARLIISVGTVKRHTHSIYEKLHVGNRRDAIARAASVGLLVGRA